MSYEEFKRYILGLGENGKIMIADYEGVIQSCAVLAFSDYCAYGVYSGNIEGQHQGANKLLYWETIRLFKELGVQRFDFGGARIDPEKGSKQEALATLKMRYGAKLVRGYMWKYSFNALKYNLYCLAARFRSGGDIVDQEQHKLKNI
jgi:lipid II:glycine glycyltransferase (peptidoglycan interpeptide bridge formation enzyme)